MSGPNGDITTLLGDIGEYGGGPRVVLPESFYICTVNVDETGVSDPAFEKEQDEEGNDVPVMTLEENGELFLDANEEPVQRGGSPFVDLECAVDEGPFQGYGFKGRFWLTPGKGKNIGFVQHAANAISGKKCDVRVLKEYGFEFPATPKNLTPAQLKASRQEAQQMLRKYFYALGHDDRLDFMTKYCRLGTWDDKSAVTKVGIELGNERENETTGEVYIPEFNRYQGFYALNHAKKGAGWVRSVHHPKQTKVAVEMGLFDGGEVESPVVQETADV